MVRITPHFNYNIRIAIYLQSITQALLHLAAHRKYMGPLREEASQVVRAEGWTKRALDKMVKIDSFLTECQRFHGIGMGTYSPPSFSHLLTREFV